MGLLNWIFGNGNSDDEEGFFVCETTEQEENIVEADEVCRCCFSVLSSGEFDVCRSCCAQAERHDKRRQAIKKHQL